MLRVKNLVKTYESDEYRVEALRDISKKRIERLLGEVTQDDLSRIIKILRYNFVNL